MKDKIERCLYEDCWLYVHTIISILIAGIVFTILKLIDVQFNKLLNIINSDTISLLAAMAGFVFAGMSIFISTDGAKKMNTIKSIGKAHIIYNILIGSIVSFVVSMLLMLIDINVLCFFVDKMTSIQKTIKCIIEWLSLYTFLFGFICFFSSLKLIYWIFKDN